MLSTVFSESARLARKAGLPAAFHGLGTSRAPGPARAIAVTKGVSPEMTTIELPPRNKRVSVEFVGGDIDGLVVDSGSDDTAEQCLVEMVWVLTDSGSVGRRLQGLPASAVLEIRRGTPLQFRQRGGGIAEYRVFERLDRPSGILIRVRHPSHRRPRQKPSQVTEHVA